MAFEGISTTDLTTMRDETRTSYLRSLNATAYNIGTRGLSRPQPEQLAKLLSDICAELARRSDQTGGIGVVELGEP